MNKIYIIVLLFVVSGIQAQSPFTFLALKSNPTIEKFDQNLEPRSELTFKLDLATNTFGKIDIDTVQVFPKFKEIQLIDCDIDEHFTASVNSNRISIFALPSSTVAKDTICFKIVDSLGVETSAKVFLSVRPLLTLPFFDDFVQNKVDSSKWTDGYVFVNYGMAINPPSLGVATFDGINEKGKPYGGGHGLSDFFTSTFIDLSNQENDSLFLSFFLQPKGYGLQPFDRDSFVIEVLDANGVWKHLGKIQGITQTYSLKNSPKFSFYRYFIPSSLRHQGFRFRFKNYSPREGMLGLWHLDHVRLAKSTPVSGKVPDLAFGELPSSPLKLYQSMPFKQLKGNVAKELTDSIQIRINNNYSELLKAENSIHSMIESRSGNILLNPRTLLEVPPVVPQNQRDLDTGYHNFTNKIETMAIISNLENALASAPINEISLRSNYSYTQNIETIGGFTEYFDNNSVSKDFLMKNYYAYDDGAAELALAVNSDSQFQSMLAVKYTANVTDTLNGIQILIPNMAVDVSAQEFRLFIHQNSLESPPIYTSQILKPIHTNNASSGMTLYALTDSDNKPISLIINPGDFFVAYQQITATSRDYAIPIGYDRNNPNAVSQIFYNTGAGWQNFGSASGGVNGALMIRPQFGPALPMPIGTKETLITANDKIAIFPNPVSNTLYINTLDNAIKIKKIAIYNILGEMLISRDGSENEINTQSLPSGNYIIQVTTPSYISNKKFTKI